MAAKPSSDDIQKTLLSTFDRIRKPWKHQEDVLAMAAGKVNFGLFLEPGCGKSLLTIMLARFQMHHRKRAMKTLVLCPPIVVQNWKQEWLAASKFADKTIVPVVGTGKKRAELIKANYDANVLITNYESLLMDDVLQELKIWKPEILVYDESQKTKSPTAKRSKLAYELARCTSVLNRYILSGSPILNSLMDLFQQFLIMDLGATFGTNYFVFRNTYFVDRNAGMPPQKHYPNWQLRQNAVDEITAKISASSVAIKKEECLTLPPLVKTVIKVQMSAEQKRLYKEVEKDFIAFLLSRTVVARTALTKGLRLMQIASGFLALEGDEHGEKSEVSLDDNPKDSVLSELLEELSQTGKIICWAAFRKNYDSIRSVCRKLDLGVVELHGGISQKVKDEAVIAFNSDPKIKVLIGHPGSGGIGINLIAAKFTVYYSRTFSLEHDLQSEARNYRGGSETHDKITRYDLVMEDTIEEHIAAKLAAKEDVSDSILKELMLGRL